MGFSGDDLKRAGFDADELYVAGFARDEILRAGFILEDTTTEGHQHESFVADARTALRRASRNASSFMEDVMVPHLMGGDEFSAQVGDIEHGRSPSAQSSFFAPPRTTPEEDEEKRARTRQAILDRIAWIIEHRLGGFQGCFNCVLGGRTTPAPRGTPPSARALALL